MSCCVELLQVDLLVFNRPQDKEALHEHHMTSDKGVWHHQVLFLPCLPHLPLPPRCRPLTPSAPFCPVVLWCWCVLQGVWLTCQTLCEMLGGQVELLLGTPITTHNQECAKHHVCRWILMAQCRLTCILLSHLHNGGKHCVMEPKSPDPTDVSGINC